MNNVAHYMSEPHKVDYQLFLLQAGASEETHRRWVLPAQPDNRRHQVYRGLSSKSPDGSAGKGKEISHHTQLS